MQFGEPRALELFRQAGQRVEGDLVRFDPEFVLEQVAKAPSEFTVHARNPEHDVHIGGDRMVFLPAQGPPFVRMGDERHDGTLADLVDFIKLAQMQPELDTPGGNICEPDDVPLDSRHLVQTLALIVHSDKIFKGLPHVAHGERGHGPHGRDPLRRARGDRAAADAVRQRQRQLAAALRRPHARGDARLRRAPASP